MKFTLFSDTLCHDARAKADKHASACRQSNGNAENNNCQQAKGKENVRIGSHSRRQNVLKQYRLLLLKYILTKNIGVRKKTLSRECVCFESTQIWDKAVSLAVATKIMTHGSARVLSLQKNMKNCAAVMAAARAGAERVDHIVELKPTRVLFKRIIAQNGLSHRICIHRSFEAYREAMDKKSCKLPNIVIAVKSSLCESYVLFCEQRERAKEENTEGKLSFPYAPTDEGCLVLPARTDIFCQVVNVQPQTYPLCVPIKKNISGVDLRRFNKLATFPSTSKVFLRDIAYTPISKPALMCKIAMGKKSKKNKSKYSKKLQIPVKKKVINGLQTDEYLVANAVLTFTSYVFFEKKLGKRDEKNIICSSIPEVFCKRIPDFPLSVTLFETSEHISMDTVEGSAVRCRMTVNHGKDHTFTISRLKPNKENAAASLAAAASTGTSYSISRWHFAMMNDYERNSKYDTALIKTIYRIKNGGAKCEVLDVGAGSGLLAMMAARAGADKVASCEVIKDIAATATDIVADNDYSSKVQIFAELSSALSKDDLNFHENEDGAGSTQQLLVSEIVDVGLLGESVIPSIRHASTQLLSHPKIIPSGAAVYAMAIELLPQPCSDAYMMSFAPTSWSCAGFDFSPIAEIPMPGKYEQSKLNALHFKQLTGPFQVATFDLNQLTSTDEEDSQTYSVTMPVVAPGRVTAIAFWFYLHLDPAICISSGPDNLGSCWNQAVQLLNESQVCHIKGQQSSFALNVHVASTSISFSTFV